MTADPALVIFAAGRGSRFNGCKQMQPVSDSGHTLMEYSIYDAYRCGFKNVVMVISSDMEQNINSNLKQRLRNFISLQTVVQKKFEPKKYFKDSSIKALAKQRNKPWGTAHALLCAAPYIPVPFCVINADDFYGRESFKLAYDFLSASKNPEEFALIAYKLNNTLSDSGSVSRGICEVDNAGHLKSIVEKRTIFKNDGLIYDGGNKTEHLNPETFVSMNFWAFKPVIFNFLDQLFSEFIQMKSTDKEAEFALPECIGKLLLNKHLPVKVLATTATWTGLTYKNDLEHTIDFISDLTSRGIYPSELWTSRP